MSGFVTGEKELEEGLIWHLVYLAFIKFGTNIHLDSKMNIKQAFKHNSEIPTLFWPNLTDER